MAHRHDLHRAPRAARHRRDRAASHPWPYSGSLDQWWPVILILIGLWIVFTRSMDLLRREAGIAPSMGTIGDAYDNVLAEAFFATLETELLMQHAFATRKAARLALFDFIEGFYNSAGGTLRSDTSPPQSSSGGGGSGTKSSEDTLGRKWSVKQRASVPSQRDMFHYSESQPTPIQCEDHGALVCRRSMPHG